MGNIKTQSFSYFLTTYICTARRGVLLEKLRGLCESRNSPRFMEHEVSLPNSHVCAKYLYHEQAQFSHDPEILLPENPFYCKLLIYAWFSKVGSSFGVFYQTQVYVSPLSHRCYITVPSHYSTFYNKNIIVCAMHIIKLIIMRFSPLPLHLVSLMPKYSPNTLYQITQSAYFPRCQWSGFTPIQNNVHKYKSVY